jgi:hypothetical protein
MTLVVAAYGQDLPRFTRNQGLDFRKLVNLAGRLIAIEGVARKLVKTLSLQESEMDFQIFPVAHEDGCRHHFSFGIGLSSGRNW